MPAPAWIVATSMPSPARDPQVHCPGCGAPATDHGTGHQPSRWGCSTTTCAFHRGWRLRLAHHEGLEPVDGENTVYAVPVSSAGLPLPAGAVLWPSAIAAAGRATHAKAA